MAITNMYRRHYLKQILTSGRRKRLNTGDSLDISERIRKEKRGIQYMVEYKENQSRRMYFIIS